MKQYTIKPLVWTEHLKSSVAETWFGTISIIHWSADEFIVYRNNKYIESSLTLEAAKLAAERWYVKQLEQALNPTGE